MGKKVTGLTYSLLNKLLRNCSIAVALPAKSCLQVGQSNLSTFLAQSTQVK